jgi:hypothetical protein
LFLRLAAIAACSCVTTEDFVLATLERTALPHDLNTAAHATQLTIYDDEYAGSAAGPVGSRVQRSDRSEALASQYFTNPQVWIEVAHVTVSSKPVARFD